MARYKVRVDLDKKKLYETIQESEGLPSTLQGYVSQITGKANALSSGFRTEETRDYSTGQMVGGTQPRYAGDVEKKRNTVVGLIHPTNYAAMKDNYLHNTLLKSL